MPPQILLFNALVGTNVSLFSENIFFTNLFMLHVRIPSLMIPSNAKFPASCGHAKSIPLLDPVLYYMLQCIRMVVYGFRPLPVMNETIFRMNSFIASAHAGTHKQTGVYNWLPELNYWFPLCSFYKL